MGSIVKLVIHSRGKGITVLDVALAVLTGDTRAARVHSNADKLL